MADETWIDTAAARRHFKVTGEVAVRLEEALKRVEAIRATMPEPWGTDEYGKRFAMNNDGRAAKALTDLHELVGHLRKLMEDGITQIDRFEAVDGDNAAAVGRP